MSMSLWVVAASTPPCSGEDICDIDGMIVKRLFSSKQAANQWREYAEKNLGGTYYITTLPVYDSPTSAGLY